MNQIMYTATNTMSQLQSKIDIISNNVANTDTTGYKGKTATFNDLLVQQVNNQARTNEEIGRLTPNGIRVGSGAKIGNVKLQLTQGALKQTDRELDFALTNKDLMFTIGVKGEDGFIDEQFTRDGTFYLTPTADNPGGRLELVTANGNAVLDQYNQPITVVNNVDSISLSTNGRLTFTFNGGAEQSYELGMISVQNPQYLTSNGNNLYSLANVEGIEPDDIFTDLIGDARGQISVQQGYLEKSNVDLSKELTELISTQRLYQFQSQTISMADQMSGLINNIR